jgi:ribosomal peptide maturation radical SAM protein 1
VHIALQDKLRPVTGDPASLHPSTRSRRAQWPVCLVTMPFQDHLRPSIQIGLLKAIISSHGFPADTMHMNLDFAIDFGVPLYKKVFEHDRARSAGDWLFSLVAFGPDSPDPDGRFVADCRDQLAFSDDEVEQLLAFRRQGVARYVDRMVDQIDGSRYRVIGFTSTFAQTVPSLALASALKRRYPDLVVVFGGANLDGPMGMELVRSMACIDYAVTGEGDVAFTDLLVSLSDGRDPAGLPGVLCRRDGEVADAVAGPPFDRLDDLPTPDYTEYFERASRCGIVPEHGRHAVWLPAESSRGCWWGAKRHCTFCGLNGSTMAYRSKSAARVRAELAELSAQTSVLNFGFVDNILDTVYLEQLFPALDDGALDYKFFFEIKSNMSREHIRTLRDGGVRRIQPGIESLSSHVLGLMRKGVRASQNVNLLRWAHFYGIDVTWNLIHGFPNELASDYREQAELIPDLLHLQPPQACGRIWMERFSPIFTDRAAFPAKWVEPEKGLRYIYPADVNLAEVAFFFDYELENTMSDTETEETRKAVAAWQEASGREVKPSLTLHRAADFIQIVDGRDAETVGVSRFDGSLSRLYLGLMDKPLTAKAVADATDIGYPVEEVKDALDEFVARGLMMRDGALYLSLALPASPWR